MCSFFTRCDGFPLYFWCYNLNHACGCLWFYALMCVINTYVSVLCCLTLIIMLYLWRIPTFFKYDGEYFVSMEFCRYLDLNSFFKIPSFLDSSGDWQFHIISVFYFCQLLNVGCWVVVCQWWNTYCLRIRVRFFWDEYNIHLLSVLTRQTGR